MIATNLSLISESCKNGVHAQMCLQDFFCSTRCQALSVFPFFEILSSCFRHQIQRFLSKIVPTDARVDLRVPDFTASWDVLGWDEKAVVALLGMVAMLMLELEGLSDLLPSADTFFLSRRFIAWFNLDWVCMYFVQFLWKNACSSVVPLTQSVWEKTWPNLSRPSHFFAVNLNATHCDSVYSCFSSHESLHKKQILDCSLFFRFFGGPGVNKDFEELILPNITLRLLPNLNYRVWL